MQRLESKKSRTRSASTRRRSKIEKDFSYINDEATERLSRPRLTENFNDEITNKYESIKNEQSNTIEQKLKKRNSMFSQITPSMQNSRKSLGPLLDMELSKHASFTGQAMPQSQMPSQFKAQIQVQSQDLAITQAKLFAEACAQAMAKADEIAQIEADAQLTYVPPDFHENIQQQLNRSRSSSKSKVKIEYKDSCCRRLPIIPQKVKEFKEIKKENQPIYSNRSKSHEHRRVAFSSTTNHQVTNRHEQNEQPSSSTNKKEYDVVEKLLIREQLLKKQEELLAQERLSRQHHQEIMQQHKIKTQMQDLQAKSKRASLCSNANYLY